VRAIRNGLVLLFLQLLLVLSVAGKYLYERQTRPRVWTRATQFDPALPLRGRYLGVTLLLDACGLPRETSRRFPQYYRGRPISWQWKVSLSADNGRLRPTVDPHSGQILTLLDGKPCDRATLNSQEMLFIPDNAQLPFPLKPGQDLWVEVTLPASGPPRPLQVAVQSAEGFRPLKLD
jgi:hypothetical protein